MAGPKNVQLEFSTAVGNRRQQDDDSSTMETSSGPLISNGNRCGSPSVYRRDDHPVVVDMDVCSNCPTAAAAQRLRRDENVPLENVMVNRGMIHRFTVWYGRQSTIPLSYVIGIPFGWLLLGTFQYIACVVILGDVLLDPWYFTCTWIGEVITMLPMTVFIIVAKCVYVRVDILEYCEKISWTHFTFLIFQGLAIALFLLPVSHWFKYAFGDFSRPINFFIYWTVFAFPHIMVLYFSTFGCCSKIFRAFSRHLRNADSWNKQENPPRVHSVRMRLQETPSVNNDNNIELQELNYHPMNRGNKDLQFSAAH